MWLVKIDHDGDMLWDQSFGGSDDEGFYSGALAATPDGGFLLGADSRSDASSISWPRSAENYLLDVATALDPSPAATPWTEVPPPYETNDTHISITVPKSTGSRFFRLRNP